MDLNDYECQTDYSSSSELEPELIKRIFFIFQSIELYSNVYER